MPMEIGLTTRENRARRKTILKQEINNFVKDRKQEHDAKEKAGAEEAPAQTSSGSRLQRSGCQSSQKPERLCAQDSVKEEEGTRAGLSSVQFSR